MTFVQRSAAEPAADAEYITAVRGGDTAAYAVLYERHRSAAYHLARQLVGSSSEADDLVSDAFTKVFNTLLSGGGPDSAFRAYLLTSVRNTFYDSARRGKKVTYTDDLEPHDEGQPFVDTAVAGLDSTMAAKAFARLPERWQTVLWHTEIEGESPAEVAPLLGLTANAAAALAYRAREGLRQAFLQEHIADVGASSCKVTTDRLGAWARGGLSKREQAQVDGHLDECDRCAAVAAEISDLGAGLRGVVAVLAIGTAPLTAAYLAGGTAAKIGALAWAGVGAPAAGFAKISALIATPAATTTTAMTGAAVTSSTPAGVSNAAGSTSRGLIGAIAGTAAVAAIATAVIVGSSYDDPKPSATDAGLGSSSSAAPTKGSNGATSSGAAPSAATPSASDSASPTSVQAPSGRTTYGGDIGDLPAIPPIITDAIPGLDPTIPALPSTPAYTPPPAPENPGNNVPTPPDPDPKPDPNPDPNPDPKPSTASPTYQTPPGNNVIITRPLDGLLDTSRAVAKFYVTNPGTANVDATYQAPTFTIEEMPGLSKGTGIGTSTCTVTVAKYVNSRLSDSVGATESGEPTTKDDYTCGDQPLTFTLSDLEAGYSFLVTVSINLEDDLTGIVSEPIRFTFDAGKNNKVNFTAAPTLLVPLVAPGTPAGGGTATETTPSAGSSPATSSSGPSAEPGAGGTP